MSNILISFLQNQKKKATNYKTECLRYRGVKYVCKWLIDLTSYVFKLSGLYRNVLVSAKHQDVIKSKSDTWRQY